ncbi:DUF6093 family protein [Arthrobacter woluwensis]|uniref:DUF6093 family protein n=1 Tax=Arthrobacter woluwensis TaxID=156980 RepID=UPI002467E151|nr:DUF6093 family protein [Arthrobacter woluwensis]
MSPLPNAKVIPDGWAAHHRPVAEGTMTAPGKITRSNGAPPHPKPSDWQPETDLVTDCTFRVQELKRENAPVPAAQPTQERRYLITMPLGKAPAGGLRVGEEGDIVNTVGRRFRIMQTMTGSLLWELDLICTDNLTQNGG